MTSTQYWTDHDHGVVRFIDNRENHHSVLAQPRDIQLVRPLPGTITTDDVTRIREDIAVNIRVAQGANPLSVRKNLKWS